MWCNWSVVTTALPGQDSASRVSGDTEALNGKKRDDDKLYNIYFIYLFFDRSFRTFWIKMSMNTVIREKKLMTRNDLAIMSSTY